MSLLLQGGSVIRLFHKELEAFVVAEGLFDDEVTEDGTLKESDFRIILTWHLHDFLWI